MPIKIHWNRHFVTILYLFHWNGTYSHTHTHSHRVWVRLPLFVRNNNFTTKMRTLILWFRKGIHTFYNALGNLTVSIFVRIRISLFYMDRVYSIFYDSFFACYKHTVLNVQNINIFSANLMLFWNIYHLKTSIFVKKRIGYCCFALCSVSAYILQSLA